MNIYGLITVIKHIWKECWHFRKLGTPYLCNDFCALCIFVIRYI